MHETTFNYHFVCFYFSSTPVSNQIHPFSEKKEDEKVRGRKQQKSPYDGFFVSRFQKFDQLLCLEIYLVVCCQCWFSHYVEKNEI